MTDGEKMIWAATYASCFLSELQHFRVNPAGIDADRQRQDYEQDCAVRAADMAALAVDSFRRCAYRLFDEVGRFARDMHSDMGDK